MPEHCLIKGNISAGSGERLYHTPDSPWYEQTEIDTNSGERWFCTEQEAQDAGWRAPQRVQAAPTPAVAHAASPSVCEMTVNVNTGSVEELETLPGIGPVKAQSIVDYRRENGDFRSVEELDNVRGIGEKTLEKIAPCIVIR